MRRLIKPLLAAMLTAGLLAGCWLDDDDDDVPAADTSSVPDSAGASNAAFVAYIGALGSDDTSEPKTIGSAFTAAADDSTEPLPVPGP